MKKIVFLAAFLLLSPALALAPKPISLTIAIDMTGSAVNDPGYIKENKVTFVSLLRMLTKGDKLKIIRICRNAETVITDYIGVRSLSKGTLRRYRDVSFRNCTDKNSAITEALRKASKSDHIAIFTDGGLADDTQSSAFGQVASSVAHKNVWFSGMSNQKRNGKPMKDSILEALPRSGRFITSGIHDIDSGYSIFIKRIREARR